MGATFCGYLRQSTSAAIKLGPFEDPSTGAAETGLTINQADIRLSKNGGNFAQSNDTGGGTHDEDGYYDATLDTTDTNTLGRLIVAVTDASARPVRLEWQVLDAVVYDSLFAANGTDYLQVDIRQFLGVSNAATNMFGFFNCMVYKFNKAAASSTTVDLTGAPGVSSDDDAYLGWTIITQDGTGKHSTATVTGYVGSTKVATFFPAIPNSTDGTTDWLLIPIGMAAVQTWLNTAVSLSPTTQLPEVDAASISNNTAAADNLEANIGNLDTTISSRASASVCTESRLAELDSGNLPTDISNNNIGIAANLTAINALNDLGTADIDARLTNFFATVTYAQPSVAAPTTTPTLVEMLNYMYVGFTHKKVENSTGGEVYANDGTTILFKYTHTYDSVSNIYTKNAMISG